MGTLIQILIFVFLLVLGYGLGSYFEARHYRSIRQRELQTRLVPLVTFGGKKHWPNDVQDTQLFVGTVVISIDYFKRISAALRNLEGGQITVYESLLERGRREALLRMKEQGIAWGATQILNVRLKTSTIGGRSGDNGGLGSIEIIAYGTGIR